MDEPPVDIHALDFPGLSLLLSAIPITIKRRMPGVLLSSIQRLADANDQNNQQATKKPESLKKYLETNSISPMGDHCHLGLAPEWSEGDLQRPATASSTTLNDLDSTFSSNSSTQGDSFGMELARLEEPVVTGTTGYEIDSGIQWSRVLPALNLLRNAVYEAQQPRADGQLVRSLYTGAIGYLLDALPADLNQDEAARIQQNIPGHLGAALQARLDGNRRSGGFPAAGNRPRRSYIHRTLASIIIYIFIVFKFIAPFIKSMAYSLYQYERSHRVTERVAGVAMGAAQTCARYGVDMGSAILRKDGTPTGGMTGLLIWWTENIAGGIYEGVGQGLSITGMDQPSFWTDVASRLAS
ncbi:hypothetical protein BJX96DRAFT_153459 [Aspergillus floccosus]